MLFSLQFLVIENWASKFFLIIYFVLISILIFTDCNVIDYDIIPVKYEEFIKFVFLTYHQIYTKWKLSNSNSVQFSRSVISHSLRPHGLQHARFPVHHPLLKLAQTHVHGFSDAIQPSHPLSSHSPAVSLSQHQDLSSESVLCISWPKYQTFSCSIIPSSEYSELISFRKYWLDLLAFLGTLKGLLQHHSSKASILRHSAFIAEVLLELIDKNYYGPHFLCSMKCHWTWNYSGYQHSQLFRDIGFAVVQWLAFCIFTAKGLGSTPGWRTKIPQARPCNQ